MSRPLRAEGIEFVRSAPKRWSFSEPVRASQERAFAAISADPSTWTWFPGLTSGRYVGTAPPGVGSIREVRMGRNVYRETILAWDAPERWAYRVDAMTPPLAKALVEEWTVLPAADGCVVRWTFAIDPRALFVATMPVATRVMGRLFAKAMRNLSASLAG